VLRVTPFHPSRKLSAGRLPLRQAVVVSETEESLVNGFHQFFFIWIGTLVRHRGIDVRGVIQ
jgi:hypothetical protein